jgi:zinc protease
LWLACARTTALNLALAFAAAWTLFGVPSLLGAASNYTVIVSAKTAGDNGWQKVVDTLAAQHKADVIVFGHSVEDLLPALKKQFPRYACFVAQPEEVTREFVAKVHQIVRHLDDDPYTDCFWGILTGYDSTNALLIAKQARPLIIHKVLSGTSMNMETMEEGRCFSELEKGRCILKKKGGGAQELKCPDDSTESLVNALNNDSPDLVVTSGHATEHDWMIGFRYRNGFFKHAEGGLYGEDMQKRKLPIQSPNPKVYMPVGNCLMGHIDGQDCMATAWMNSAGVRQMIGYTVTTWYGYGGWGVMDYFVEQPGRYTFNEAFCANQIALENRLADFFPELVELETDALKVESMKLVAGDAAKAAGLAREDGLGLYYDRDTVAFYGDPAWQARMADKPKAFDQKLTVKRGTYAFEIKPRHGSRSFKPTDLNGSQRGGRPFLAFLPHRVREVKITEGKELNPLVTENFILVPNPGECNPAKTYRVVFTATPIH